MTPLRVAFAGFRHGHIREVYARVQERPDTELVGAFEAHEPTRQALASEGKVRITHASLDALFDEARPDVLAIGDCYGLRGALALRALERGLHVISDKPLCTRLGELDRIEALARARGLAVGCQFGLRQGAMALTARAAIQAGEIGEVHAISFGGQHPLLHGTRPGWYFEPGLHGGTINDIAVHAVNAIPWITGRRLVRVAAARAWNARLKQVPHFQDAAQFMAVLDNGGGVFGDVSYLMPDSFGYGHPLYWRFEFWGSDGVLEIGAKRAGTLWKNGEREARPLTAPAPSGVSYLDAFLNEIRGRRAPDQLTTDEVLDATRTTLLIQRAADEGLSGVDIPAGR